MHMSVIDKSLCMMLDFLILDMISHSLSVNESKYIFRYLLPDLTGQILLDVWSRLGTVLYMVSGSCICKTY